MYAVNAFTVSWTALQFYAFPPFSLIPRVLAKIVTVYATGLLIIPQWTTQSWFPEVLKLLIQHLRRIAPRKDLLHIPHQPHMVHPLYKKLSLLAVHLSGRYSLVSAYRLQLQPSSRNHGDLAPQCNMIPFSRDRPDFCSPREVHPISPTIYDILAYLTSLTISEDKSVLSGILHIPGVTAISEHPLIIRLLKGIFHVHPPQLRYELIWDTDLVLSYLKNLSSSKYSLPYFHQKLLPC